MAPKVANARETTVTGICCFLVDFASHFASVPMFVERKVHYSALLTNLVGRHAGVVSFPLSDVILAQIACPLSDVMIVYIQE